MFVLTPIVLAFAAASMVGTPERRIDPTWLHRILAATQERKSDITTPTCHYKPLFGEGDADRSAVAGIARYGEALLDPHGSCSTVQLPEEDQITLYSTTQAPPITDYRTLRYSRTITCIFPPEPAIR
jgi:hypothetical protein